MKNVASSLSDTELLSATKTLILNESKLTVKVLWHLREVEKRMLFARSGFQSLYEYATQELGYSEGATHRRIASMRLLKELPELESKVESGALPLSTLAQAHSFFRIEKIKDAQIKRDVICELENKSHREVQRQLMTRSTQTEKHFCEVLKPLSTTHHKMSVLLDESMLKDLEELQALLPCSQGNPSLQEVIKFALKKALEIKRPKAPKIVTATPAPELQITQSMQKIRKDRSRYIAIELRRQVWSRDNGCCTFRDHQSGKLCGSKSGLQMDHIEDFASGGEHTLNNLRLRCRAHNTLAALDRFGPQKMSQFVSSLQ